MGKYIYSKHQEDQIREQYSRDDPSSRQPTKNHDFRMNFAILSL